ncbi:Sorting nexinlike, partial [Caligus rogercresseyi]
VESIQTQQSDADLFYLFEFIKDYVGPRGRHQGSLSEREKAFHAWQQSQSMVIKKKEQRARAEMSGRFDNYPCLRGSLR